MTEFREIGAFYRSGTHNLVDDFFTPCLKVAQRYDRAVGYFTSTSLAAAATGLRPFLERPSARMRLIASPKLTDEDAEAIAEGYDLREIVRRSIDDQIQSEIPDAASDRLRLLTWLIANGRLELKLAMLYQGGQIGIYHEKIGIFVSGEGSAAFVGSANESASGLLANYESIEVFRSWVPEESERVNRRLTDFDRLWHDDTPELLVLDFPEASRRLLLERYEPTTSTPGYSVDVTALERLGNGDHVLKPPPTLELRDYQKEAIRSWWDADGRGIWEMATGTGKTVSALAALAHLWAAYRTETSMVVVVTVPYTHLADQWAEQVRAFNVEPIMCLGSRSTWSSQLDASLALQRSGQGSLTFIIAVNATFRSEAFQDRLRSAAGQLVFVSDEAHTVGAQGTRDLLPDHACFRLGLSATPDRHMDPGGTDAIRSYFGESVYELDLKRAIKLKALVPYKYFPIIVELTDEELETYVELTSRIVRSLVASDAFDTDDVPSSVERLLFERARLVGSARNKLAALEEAIEPYRKASHSLVYCADRFGEVSQLDEVVRLLGLHLGMRVASFTTSECRSERSSIIERFGTEELQVVAAIRCLDEGIDIPAIRRAFILASSQNPRQFIQRRGRVLRHSPGKESAEIFDFLVSPPDFSDDPATWNIERRLVGRELMRAIELCEASTNTADAMAVLRPLRKRYDLLHLVPGASSLAPETRGDER